MAAPDQQLTRRAFLTSAASFLDFGTRLVVGFIVTPLLVAGVGDVLFGAWLVCQRLLVQMQVTEGRAMQALRWTLGHKLASNDEAAKRRDVGSAIRVWIWFLPLQIVIGGIIVWFAPSFMNELPESADLQIKLTLAILVLNLVLSSIVKLPDAILGGSNLGYRAMTVRAGTAVLSGALMVWSVRLGYEIAGLAGSTLVVTLVGGAAFFVVARRNVPWIGIDWPDREHLRGFFSFSVWILAWGFVGKLMLTGDVIVLGIIGSPALVTSYVLTLYVMNQGLNAMGLVPQAAMPGLGGIVGEGRLAFARSVRGELMALTWLLATAMGASVILWNESFIGLWIGPEQYLGAPINLLAIVVLIQTLFIQNDSKVIDATLSVKRKVLWGTASAVAALSLSGVLGNAFGVPGLLLGLMLGRGILSIAFPALVSTAFETRLVSDFAATLRPLAASALLFACAYAAGPRALTDSWIILIVGGGFTALLVAVTAYWLGLTRAQREQLSQRVSRILHRS